MKIRNEYKLKRASEFLYLKPGTILVNSIDFYDFNKFSDIVFKFENLNYKNENFKKDFIKLIYKMNYNPDLSAQENNRNLLEIFKNYNPENLITYYLDNLSKSTYAIEIPENINKSTIFNQFKKDSMNESKHEEIPIKKIKSISEFIVKAIEYDENWMNRHVLNRITSIDEVIKAKKGVCFEMSILNFLIIKEDENLKNINIKLCAGERITSNKLRRNETVEMQITNIEEIKQYHKYEILKLIKKNGDDSKKIDEFIKEFQRIDETQNNKSDENNLHFWIEFELNKNEKYILEATSGALIPKPLTEIEPLVGTDRYVKSKNMLIPFFIKK
ncbi:hypothetical protein M1278_02625 [Candidatus Marsarchaeota archaeon]|nr:hypothetical protein [Candidatus Marsarchaeota archaeon]